MQQMTFHPLSYTSTQSEDNHPLDLSNFLDLSWPTPFSVPVYGLELSSAQGFLVRYFFWQVFSSHLFCRTVTVFIFKHSSIWTNITVKYCFWTYTESVCVQSGENLGLETYSILYFVDQNANNVKIIPICLDEMESQIKKDIILVAHNELLVRAGDYLFHIHILVDRKSQGIFLCSRQNIRSVPTFTVLLIRAVRRKTREFLESLATVVLCDYFWHQTRPAETTTPHIVGYWAVHELVCFKG